METLTDQERVRQVRDRQAQARRKDAGGGRIASSTRRWSKDQRARPVERQKRWNESALNLSRLQSMDSDAMINSCIIQMNVNMTIKVF